MDIYNQRKIKRLPLGSCEKVGDDIIIYPKMRSRSYPVKIMFMGVFGWHILYLKFDGRLLLEFSKKL